MKQFFFVLGMGLVIMSCHKKDSNPAPVLNFNVTTLSLPPVPGATADLIVESNIDWQASLSAGVDWLQVSKTSGHGNDTIHITVVKDNGQAAARSAAITASPVNSGIDLQAQATIEQKPYDVQLISQKAFGGTDKDIITDMVPTQDGGLFLVGVTSSNNTGDVRANHGDNDAWMIRLNSNRDTVWTRVMGGLDYDGAWGAIATADGGFIIAGYTDNNNNGDVGANNGSEDWWIIKLKSNGETAWTKLIGGADYDYANDIAATADGGFIVVGTSYVSTSTSVNADAMAVKFNSNGDVVWKKTFGGTKFDEAASVSVAPNGSIFIAANTESSNTGDLGINHGGTDYWVIKLKENGDREWMKLFGGNGDDSPFTIKSTLDGGAIITGASSSNKNGDVGANHGAEDLWVIKVNGSGEMVWNSLLGGTGIDGASGLSITPDGGCLLSGYSSSKDGDVGANQGEEDLWVLRLNSTGKIMWSKTYGGSGDEDASAIILNSDGSFYLGGYTESSGHGLLEGWLLKLKDY